MLYCANNVSLDVFLLVSIECVRRSSNELNSYRMYMVHCGLYLPKYLNYNLYHMKIDSVAPTRRGLRIDFNGSTVVFKVRKYYVCS